MANHFFKESLLIPWSPSAFQVTRLTLGKRFLSTHSFLSTFNPQGAHYSLLSMSPDLKLVKPDPIQQGSHPSSATGLSEPTHCSPHILRAGFCS